MKKQLENKEIRADGFTSLMQPSAGANEVGDLKIHDDALISIVRRTVLGMEGVSRLAGSSFLNDIAEMVRTKKIQEHAVVLKSGEKGFSIDVSLYIYFGVNLRELATALRQKVVQDVKAMTGLTVQMVNIKVRGMDEQNAVSNDVSVPHNSDVMM